MAHRLTIAVSLAFAIVLCVPAAAFGGFRELYDEYLQANAINGCAHTGAELQGALTSIPADISAYDPGFANAVNSALELRASGCKGGGEALEGLLDEVAIRIDVADDGSAGPAPPVAAATPALPPAASAASELPIALILGSIVVLSGLFVLSTAGLRPRRRRSGPRAFAGAAGLGSDLLFIARRRLRR